MVERVTSSCAFCTGCEFSGSIPAHVSIERQLQVKQGTISGTVLVDEELRLSNLIVHKTDIEKAPDSRAVSSIIRSCNGDECKLDQQGFIPVELSVLQKKRYVNAMLAKRAGVSEIGGLQGL